MHLCLLRVCLCRCCLVHLEANSLGSVVGMDMDLQLTLCVTHRVQFVFLDDTGSHVVGWPLRTPSN